jgi:HSP20 family protein
MAKYSMKSQFILQSVSFPSPQPAWRPPVDVYFCGQEWWIKCDLAGVCPEDIQLSTFGNCLTIQGMRRDWPVQQGQRPYCMEIAYNRFERTIEFPCNIDNAEITTDYRDGMLLLRLLIRNR